MLLSELATFGRYLDPWREFERMNRALSRMSELQGCEFPATNVWVGEDNAVVTTEIAGIDPADIDISVQGKSVTLRGSRKPEELAEDSAYHRRERWHGTFSKTLDMPFAVEADKVEARFSNGVLYIALPRAEADKPRKIGVKCE